MRIAVLAALFFSQLSYAQLSGQVASKEEGAMEGVLVSAKRAGATITVTVVSDARGNYQFPAARQEWLQIRMQMKEFQSNL